MDMFSPLLWAALALPGPDRHPTDQSPAVRVTWQGRVYMVEDLPKEVPGPARRAIHVWASWADEHGYRIELDDGGRLVFLLRAARRNASRQMDLIVETLDYLEPLAPPLQEDAEQTEVEAPAMVVIMTRGDAFSSALGKVVNENPYLASTGRQAEKLNGVAVQEPLVALFREDPSTNREWEGNLDNELVNLVAQLVQLQRYGRQPYWIKAGWAWHAELGVRGSIWSFAYRDSFVGIGEHSGWENALRSEFRRRGRRTPLTAGEVTGLNRGSYDDRLAGISWGTMVYLSRFFPENLPSIFDDLRELRIEKGRVWVTEDRWEIKPGFELSAEDQLEVLVKHTRPDLLEQLAAFFREGDRYRPDR